VIPHKLYTFVQGQVLNPLTPLAPWFNLGLSTVHPSIMNPTIRTSRSSYYTSSSSSFLPQMQISMSIDEYKPIVHCNIQKNFLGLWKDYDAKTNQDYYSAQLQLRFSPIRGLLDVSTFVSKSVSCFGLGHVSPYHVLKQGGLICTFGIQSVQRQSMDWFLRIDHDDLSLHIPIQFHNNVGHTPKSLAVSAFWTGPNIFMIVLESIRVWFLSRCIQSALQFWIQGNENAAYKNKLEKESYRLNRTDGKSLRDAMNQVESMRRRADMVRAKEEEKRGLVIEKAWYYIDGCSCQTHPCYMDVTIPLQFWVQESKLFLAAGSKRFLLGFCSLEHDCPNCRRRPAGDDKVAHVPNWLSRVMEWIRSDSWDIHISGKEPGPRILLSVQYNFNGKTYHNMFDDDDPVILPVFTL
jgi:hypothetical protein